MFNEAITLKFLKTLEKIDHGSLDVTLPNGKVYRFEGRQAAPHGTLIIHDWRTIPYLAQKGDIGFAESYKNGWWESEDLTALFTLAILNESTLKSYIYGGFLSRLFAQIMYLFSRNSLSGSKKNILAHYDLGNAFYKLWLDPSMTYSSGIYTNPLQSLLKAQQNKYDRIVERLNPSGKLLEIGCGWGGFAEQALSRNDYEIKGLTISDEQYQYAKERVKNANIALEDYRLQTGKYDNIVSIEMFEAVGESYWGGYFEKVKSLLADNGRAVIQTITIAEPYFERYKTSGDMIRTYIFPGGMLPTPSRFKEESLKFGLVAHEPFMFGKDYAKTMQEWLFNFEKALPNIRALGFDDAFIRLWRFYLTICIASFMAERTNVMQIELAHA